MMMSAAVVGLFWRLLYDPSWGPLNYVLGRGDLAWLSDPQIALYAVAILFSFGHKSSRSRPSRCSYCYRVSRVLISAR
jgi:hypothetical protein